MIQFLLENTRQDDTVCRFGGEEFMIVLLNATKNEAVIRAEKWQRDLAARQLSRTAADVRVSFSCGIVSFPQDGEDMDSLLKKADDLLYQAKAVGRNRVISS